MRGRRVLKLDAKDYKEAKKAIAEVERELESKGHDAEDIRITYTKDDGHDSRKPE